MTLNAHEKLLRQLDFSDVQNQIETLKQWLNETTTTDESKINFLKQEIAANRYAINDSLIANKMMEELTAVTS